MRRAHGHDDAVAAKATKTMKIRHQLPHMSTSAFSAFVQLAKTTDLSDVASSNKANRQAKFASLTDTPFGPVLLQIPLRSHPPHAPHDLIVVNPFAYMYNAFNTDGVFTA